MVANPLPAKLLKWFDTHGRHDLPWQHNVTPYRVWVSEIMLQQTQVATVIAYYQRFMQSFPTIQQLAHASEDAVLQHWTGLGYYARARNLHKAAKIIVAKHNAYLPTTIDELITLPGIGRSTAGAILSLSQNRRAPILDGNVKRVFSRLIALDIWPNNKTAQTQLWLLAEKLLPKKRVNDYNQALMDLGATTCTRTKPRCDICPWHNDCQAHLTHTTHLYPIKKPSKVKPKKFINLLVLIDNRNNIFLEKRPAYGIWGGLWSLPELIELDSLQTHCEQRYHCQVIHQQNLDPFQHVFSHFTLMIQPIKIRVDVKPQVGENHNSIWYDPNQALPGGTAAPILKILKGLQHESQSTLR